MNNKMNFTCDLETGICGDASEEGIQLIDFNQPEKTVDVYYVTDPICSHCWALEPVLRRFKEQYSPYFNFHVVMGGLLEKWGDGPVDPANGIFKPADVAPHWREVGELSRMPIDGTVMIENPVQSSYPPSRVFKVIQKHHGDDKAYEFLRRARENLFIFNQNISETTVLVKIVDGLGINGEKIVQEAESETGQQLLNEDFALARKLGIRGFPSIVIVNEDNQGVKIVGARTLETYIEGLKQVVPDEVRPKETKSLSKLLKKEKLLFAKEIEVMYDLQQEEVKDFVEKVLTSSEYETNEILGERYLIAKE